MLPARIDRALRGHVRRRRGRGLLTGAGGGFHSLGVVIDAGKGRQGKLGSRNKCGEQSEGRAHSRDLREGNWSTASIEPKGQTGIEHSTSLIAVCVLFTSANAGLIPLLGPLVPISAVYRRAVFP